jgi:hypothetical protein
MRGIAARRFAAAVTLAVLTVCVFFASRLLHEKGLVWAANAAAIASLVLAVATLTVPVLGKLLGWLTGSPPLSAITFEQARSGFADALAKQWAEQDRLRQVYDPWPLPVRWQTTTGASGSRANQFAGIHAAFTDTQRMVILGAAGAGKSVLASKLVRDLLDAREAGDRVPVLLPAATWTRDCTMTEWITQELVRSQPNLDVRLLTGAGERVWLPAALAEAGVIPVIDGLDELPPSRRTSVIAEINAFGSDYPLVLTSRPAEYRAATAARGISLAVEIELEPLRVPEVEEYLTEATEKPASRWQTVFQRLDAEPDGVLAQTLANPLMVWLARTVYRRGETAPDELIEPALLAAREPLEAHLVAALVPAVYAKRRGYAFRCRPEQAARWLGFLADRLNRSQGQEIAWWQLARAEPVLLVIQRAIRAVLFTCILWQVTVWALTRRGYWQHGTYLAKGHLQDLVLAGPLGRVVRPLTNLAVRWYADGLNITVTRLSTEVSKGLHYAADRGLLPYACLAAAVSALTGVTSMLGTTALAPQNLRLTRRTLTRRLLSPIAWLPALAFLWWDAAANHHRAWWAAPMWLGLVLAEQVARSARTPADVASRDDPVSLLRADRRTGLARAAVTALGFGTIWLWSGGVIMVAAMTRSVLCLIVVLLLGGSGGAWTSYLGARQRLWIAGRMPWRAMSFLEDAHRRGVLRQTGAVYQFRHIRLQEQLAAEYTPPPLASAARWAGQRLARLRPLFPLLAAEPEISGPGPDVPEYTATIDAGAGWMAQAVALLVQVLVIVALSATAVSLSSWSLFVIVPITIALLPAAIKTIDMIAAAAQLPAGPSSLRVRPDRIELTYGSRRINLNAGNVEQISVRPIGGCQTCYAVQAKPKSSHTWLPLYWTPRYTARIPRDLVSALAGFAGDRLDARLSDWLTHTMATEYEESGTVEVPDLTAVLTRGLMTGLFALCALAALFSLISWDGLAGVAAAADLIFILVCVTRLRRRSTLRKLPPGAWSLRVENDSIEVTRAGRTIRLRPDDIERLELYTPPGTVYGIVRARLLAGAAGPPQAPAGHPQTPGGPPQAPGGWFPLYWPTPLSAEIPRPLIGLLFAFAPERLAGSLKQRAVKVPRAPVRRARAPLYRDR